MISVLKPTGFKVRSLTTISTPHRGELVIRCYQRETLTDSMMTGSSVADRILEKLSSMSSIKEWTGLSLQHDSNPYQSRHKMQFSTVWQR